MSRFALARIGAASNFYRDGAGARLRRQRLRVYLEHRADATVLLVGEAPGYRGARVAGLPFTSERLAHAPGQRDLEPPADPT